MGIFDIFSAPAPAAPAPAPAPELTPPTPTPVATPAAEVSPLDEFSGAWKNDPNAALMEGVSFNADPAKMQEAAAKLDFSSVVSQEQLAAIQQGGTAASTALVGVLNKVAQAVTVNNALTTSKIVEAALTKQAAQFESALPTMMRRQQVTESLQTSNPAYNHPAVAPLIATVRNNLAAQYPDATSQQITNMTQKYMDTISSVFSGKQGEQAKNNVPMEENWDKFFV